MNQPKYLVVKSYDHIQALPFPFYDVSNAEVIAKTIGGYLPEFDEIENFRQKDLVSIWIFTESLNVDEIFRSQRIQKPAFEITGEQFATWMHEYDYPAFMDGDFNPTSTPDNPIYFPNEVVMYKGTPVKILGCINSERQELRIDFDGMVGFHEIEKIP